jgi:DNA-binding response OmpR family regulator
MGPRRTISLGSVTAERVLLVEDDDTIAAALTRALASEEYVVERVATGHDALRRYPDADLVLLDLGLPDLDGLEVCRRIRNCDAVVPIVMLTARRDEIDIVVGLEAGALDYVAKPFRLAELLARLRVQLRRASLAEEPRVLEAGGLRIDAAARRAWHDGQELVLRTKELDLLVLLVSEAGKAVTRERLMAEVWDPHWYGSTKTLDVHIASLRRKLGEEPGQMSCITTLRSVGYRFDST